MITIEKLEQLGCNTAEGMERCLNDESFYLSLVPGAFERKRYEELERMIRESDLKAAFDEAHALKGVLSNLSITPLLDCVSEITERLRAGDKGDYSAILSRMWEICSRFEGMLH